MIIFSLKTIFKFVVLLSSSALAEQCLQCSSIMSEKDQTKSATLNPSEDFGSAGLNCFQPINESNLLPTELSSMKKECPSSDGANGGCYSLAYSIKRKINQNMFVTYVSYQGRSHTEPRSIMLSNITLSVVVNLIYPNG